MDNIDSLTCKDRLSLMNITMNLLYKRYKLVFTLSDVLLPIEQYVFLI
jgi:hypothetical protein